MRRLFLVLSAAAGISGCGSGTSPATHCKQFESAVCARVFACTDDATKATADFQATWGMSAQECGAMLEAQYCATVTNDMPCATSAMHYNADRADACVADLKAESCTDFMNAVTPDSCMAICS